MWDLKRGIYFDNEVNTIEECVDIVSQLYLFQPIDEQYNCYVLIKNGDLYIRKGVFGRTEFHSRKYFHYLEKNNKYYYLQISIKKDIETFEYNGYIWYKINEEKIKLIKDFIEISKIFIELPMIKEIQIYNNVLDNYITVITQEDKRYHINKDNYKVLQKQLYEEIKQNWEVVKTWKI